MTGPLGTSESLRAASARADLSPSGTLTRDPGRSAARDPGSASGRARVEALDGIRGWAALMVVAYHVFYETMGAAFPDFRGLGFRVFNGSFAVFIFFVLSGEALSASFFAGGGTRAIASLAVKRHSRLTIPVLASVLTVLALQRANLVFSAQAARLVHREDWLGQAATMPLTLGACVKYAFYQVYLPRWSGPDIIPFLWTMSAEMLGSIFVFAILSTWDSLRYRTPLLLGLAAFLLGSFGTGFLGTFVAGMLFGKARHDGALERLSRRRGMPVASLLAMVATLLVVGLGSIEDKRLHAAAAVVLLAAIYLNRSAMAFFATGLSKVLGRLSFPLYLVHFSVLISVTSGLIVVADARGQLDQGHAIAIGLFSIVVALVAAMLFDPVERLTKAVGHRLAATFVEPRRRG